LIFPQNNWPQNTNVFLTSITVTNPATAVTTNQIFISVTNMLPSISACPVLLGITNIIFPVITNHNDIFVIGKSNDPSGSILTPQNIIAICSALVAALSLWVTKTVHNEKIKSETSEMRTNACFAQHDFISGVNFHLLRFYYLVDNLTARAKAGLTPLQQSEADEIKLKLEERIKALNEARDAGLEQLGDLSADYKNSAKDKSYFANALLRIRLAEKEIIQPAKESELAKLEERVRAL
jgi:hypothetical protein